MRLWIPNSNLEMEVERDGLAEETIVKTDAALEKESPEFSASPRLRRSNGRLCPVQGKLPV